MPSFKSFADDCYEWNDVLTIFCHSQAPSAEPRLAAGLLLVCAVSEIETFAVGSHWNVGLILCYHTVTCWKLTSTESYRHFGLSPIWPQMRNAIWISFFENNSKRCKNYAIGLLGLFCGITQRWHLQWCGLLPTTTPILFSFPWWRWEIIDQHSLRSLFSFVLVKWTSHTRSLP